MDKRTLILDAMQELIINDKGAACSVSDIARQAGIGKGSIYYYFKSKEEILDALVDRQYGKIIENCENVLQDSNGNAIQKIAILIQTYYASSVENSVDHYLHEPQNAYIHQKSLATILLALSPILSSIIQQGNEEGIFHCSYPEAFSELLLSEFCFVFDYGIFTWSANQMHQKFEMLSEVLERCLQSPEGSFAFLSTAFNQFTKRSKVKLK